jgi:hypothetical protein
VKVQALLDPLTPVAEVPLTRKSSAAGPFTAALKVTVMRVRLLTTPGAGEVATTVGAEKAAGTTVVKQIPVTKM